MMPAMDEQATRRTVLRSSGSMALGITGSVLLVVLAVVSGWSAPVFTALALLGAVGCHVLLTYPHVRLDLQGVTVANPLRRTLVPWARLDGLRSRWNLEVWSDTGETITAWGLSAAIRRPRHSALLPSWRVPRDAGIGADRGDRSAGNRGMNAQVAQELIEQAHDEWRELCTDGAVDATQPAGLQRDWVWSNVAIVGLALALAAVASLT